MAKIKAHNPALRIGSLDYYLAEVPNGRELSLIWARALAITGVEKYKAFIAAYDGRDRDSQPLEDFCKEAKLDPVDYLGDFVKTSMRYSNLHIDIMKVANLPEVYRKSLEVAQTDGGFDDRHAILQGENLHHAPKGNQININQQQLNASGLPSMADFTKQMEAALDEPLQLPATTTEFVEGQIVREDEKVRVER